MKLGFEETQAAYSSGSQKAKAWTERWVKDQLYCPNCGNPSIRQFPANRPVADFVCPACDEEFELKSQKAAFGQRVNDGAFRTMCERLAASNNPNLLLLNYDRARLQVHNAVIIPKHFFIREIIEERKPLRATARRAGWVGCNILIGHPSSRKNLHRPKRSGAAEGNRPRRMEEDAFPPAAKFRGSRLARRSHEMRRIHRRAGIRSGRRV